MSGFDPCPTNLHTEKAEIGMRSLFFPSISVVPDLATNKFDGFFKWKVYTRNNLQREHETTIHAGKLIWGKMNLLSPTTSHTESSLCSPIAA